MSEPHAPRGKLVPLRPPRPCPICGRRGSRDTYPFCSKRCADADLDRWLAGHYAIPGERAVPGYGDDGVEG